MSSAQQSLEGIAIVGMAGRFPGSRNISEFWRNLLAGDESFSTSIDAPPRAFASASSPCLLERPEWFDAAFFDIPESEAVVIDPQQRIFLEECWTALEDAACVPSTFAGSIGVFASVGRNSYWTDNVLPRPDLIDAVGPQVALVGNEKDYFTSRAAYKLGLRGPAITVQTGDSSSLVAVALAIQSLQTFGSDLALAGGVSIVTQHDSGPELLGSGAGVVALKRLTDAVTDGDHIYAVIKSAAVNNDGGLKPNFADASADGHAEVIAMAHALAGISAESIAYVEASGTRFDSSESTEVIGLTRAFRTTTQNNNFCALGCVKSNVGNLGAASGIAALIKTALALSQRKIPPTRIRPEASGKPGLEETPFRIASEVSDWMASKHGLRRAGVSAFGIGGTNAHLIVDEAPVRVTAETGREENVLVLSARTEAALAQRASDLADHIEEHPGLSLADIAYTLQIGRTHFDLRRAVVCPNREVAISALRGFEAKRTIGGTAHATEVAFLFPGQGAQFTGMGARLYEGEPVFRKALNEACEVLHYHVGLNLRRIIHPAEKDRATAVELLREERYAQPACFAVSVALARFWISVGCRPSALFGHGVGELAAAVIARVFSLDDAASIVAARARIFHGKAGNCLLAVRAAEADVVRLLDRDVTIVAVNSPSSCILEGDDEAIAKIESRLKAGGCACKRLDARGKQAPAEALEQMAAVVRATQRNAPGVRIVSSVTGQYMDTAQTSDPEYWTSHANKTIRFSDGVSTLLAEKNLAFIECGPGGGLSQMLRQHPAPRLCAQSLKEGSGDYATIYKSLSQMWISGIQINWESLHSGEVRSRVPLPPYPFERRRFWAEAGGNSLQKNVGPLPKIQPTTTTSKHNLQKTL